MENLVGMFEKYKNIYKGKKVFLTGHTGFKGAWLLKILSMLGAEVKGYALAPPDKNSLYELISGDSLCNSIIDDIRNKESLKKEVLSFDPDIIFHLAAQPLVTESYDFPLDTFEINALRTAYLLDAIQLLNKQCSVVVITTDKVYHNKEWAYSYRENDRLGGYDPYSASKACAELIIKSYRNSFFNIDMYATHQKAIAVARAGNVIGGGDWSKDRLIPDIVRALSVDKLVSVRNPLSVRPWQHVLDPLEGYLLLGASLQKDPVKFSQAYNFGPVQEDMLTVEQIVQLAINQWGNGSYNNEPSVNHKHEAGLLKLDITKAMTELKWKPKMNINLAIETTIQWYKCFFNKRDKIVQFTEDQISSFMN